ncbi:MAG: MopE-related protein, partial [Myxococcota bacterium]
MFIHLRVLLLGVGIMGLMACQTEPTKCTNRSDCPDAGLYSCVAGRCFLSCQRDADCTQGERCNTLRFCGEIPKGARTDPNPKSHCNEGEVQTCYTASVGCVEAEGVYTCKGVCTAGKQTCSAEQKWGACTGENTPDKEICDGKDNNCDGVVDEGCENVVCTLGQMRACFPAALGCKEQGDQYTCIGRCKSGMQTCETSDLDSKPGWGECEGAVLPYPRELCNNQEDDNCDGQVNENCTCVPGQSRPCKAESGCAGVQVCRTEGEGTVWKACVAASPSTEVCDGFDNDCDGKVDNVKGASDKLSRECKKLCFIGTETCIDGKFQNCSAEEPVPNGQGEESDSSTYCNNRDDDCDGKIDNAKGSDEPLRRSCIPSPPTFGPCKDNAFQSCTAGKWSTCKAGPPGTQEDCNGIDDDCNGKVDDNALCPNGQECIENTL